MRALVASAVFLAGCQSTLHLGTPSGRVDSLPPGTAVSGGSLEVRSASGSFVGVAVGVGVFAAMVRGDAPRSHAPPPPMDPSRAVREVDCTQPVEPGGGNLRCR